MATETSYLNPETPHLDHVAINVIKDKQLKRLSFGGNLGMCIFSTLFIFFCVNWNSARENGDYDMYNYARGQACTSMAFDIICLILNYIADRKRDINAKKRKQLVDVMINRFSSVADNQGITLHRSDDKYHRMAAEYFLSYMTATERNNLKNHFDGLNPADKESLDDFCEYLLNLVNDVIKREDKGLCKAVADIAAGKTAVWANATQRAYGA